jgi:predicted TIM-barrel fold metal-dependent hydrolase
MKRLTMLLLLAAVVHATAAGSTAWAADAHEARGASPVVDVHAHVFNFHALPLYGILRSRSVPHLAARIVTWWLNRNVASESVEKSGSSARERPLSPSEREELENYLEGAGSVQLRAQWSADKGRPVDVELVSRVLEVAGFDDHESALPGGEARDPAGQSVPGSRGVLSDFKRFIDTLSLSEPAIVGKARATYPDVGLFVHHMMDMERAYADGPRIRFEEQVDRVAALTRASDGRLATFVAFDPFRPDGGLSLVEEAWAAGALGVKVYPPSGYRASGNEIEAAPGGGHARKRWKSRYKGLRASELDARMDRLFAWAAKNGVPILTHCTPDGMAAEKDYGHASDPRHWEPVLEQHPNLILCFAHAGGGGGWAVPVEKRGTEAELEAEYAARVVDLCTRHANASCSLDYIDEVFTEQGRAELTRVLRERTGSAGILRGKILYGTDWHMISRFENAADYLRDFRDVFADAELAPWSASFFAGNASRFLGLETWLTRLEALGDASPISKEGRAAIRELLRRIEEAESRGGR